MKKQGALFFAVPIALLALSVTVVALAEITDNTNVAVPSDNGTSSNTTVTGRMQMYVGFFGNVSMQVRNDTAVGNVLYRKTVTYGKLYFAKTGATLTAPFVAAPTNANTDGNFSLTGFYNTSNHFDQNDQSVCSIASVNRVNTTDNRMTGIYYDSAGTPNYFFCTDIGSFTSTNGFSTINYEIIVAKTPVYTSYDVWFDLS